MISTLLAEAPWLVRVGFVAIVLASPFVARWLHSRRRMAWIIAGLSAASIVALTLIPDQARDDIVCVLPFSPSQLLGPEPLANIVLFLPLVLALTVATGRPIPAFLVGMGASAAIELVQWVVPAIGRSCTSADWIANTVGALLGALLAAVGVLLARRRTKRDRPA